MSTNSSGLERVGVLALGAPGLAIWRREDPALATFERN